MTTEADREKAQEYAENEVNRANCCDNCRSQAINRIVHLVPAYLAGLEAGRMDAQDAVDGYGRMVRLCGAQQAGNREMGEQLTAAIERAEKAEKERDRLRSLLKKLANEIGEIAE